MTDIAGSKVSLFSETLKEIKTNIKVLVPYLLVIGVVFAVVEISMAFSFASSDVLHKLQSDPKATRNDPAAGIEAFHLFVRSFVIFAPLLFIVNSSALYLFSTTYLRAVVKKDPPICSLKNYFYWLGKVVWKNVRPIPWILIPVVGLFFYWRSLLRYQVVGPLALFKRGPELKRSWDLTENNVWRILLNLIGVGLVLVLSVWGVFLIPLVFLAFIGHASMIYQIVSALATATQGCIITLGSAVYSCTVYRVLLTEQRQANSVAGTPTPLTSNNPS